MQEIRHLKAEIKSKEQTLADYAHQLDAERRQVEELETSLLMQVDHLPYLSVPWGDLLIFYNVVKNHQVHFSSGLQWKIDWTICC